MRTFKFRAKPKSIMFENIDDEGIVDSDNEATLKAGKYDGSFVYGNLIVDKDECFIVGSIADDEYGSLEYWIPVIPETVGQYCEKNDLDGYELYEGDLLSDYKLGEGRGLVGYGRVGEVTFNTRHGWWELYGSNLPSVMYCSNFNLLRKIGNIHDNPELLKGAE